MKLIEHAKEMAATIIANQNKTVSVKDNNASRVDVVDFSKSLRKKTKTVGPDTQIRVGIRSPAVIINETSSGSIEEFVAISPNNNFAVFIQSNGGRVKLDKTWAELSGISAQAFDIAAFEDASGNYVLNIKKYRWQEEMILKLRSTSGSFLFNEVYANWYVYGE